jgi:leader peptidase (prepilin peptidase)/N-methyltransferase
VTAAYLAALGLALGPFLHGLAVQAGSGLPFRFGVLSCPRGHDPVRAYFRCSCGRLRWREIFTAMLTAAVFSLMTVAVGWRATLVAYLVMAAVTTILIVTDLDHFRIPNRVLYPGTAACLALLAGGAAIEGRSADLLRALAGGAVYFTLFLLVYLAARGEGFGFGDVKLAVLLGSFGAFLGWRVLAWSLLLTGILGGIPALVLLAMGRSRHTAIPYGPPLILGTWAAVIFSGTLAGLGGL